MQITYISVSNKDKDIKRRVKLDKMIKSGIKKCTGHKKTFGLHSNYDDETIDGMRLFEEQCPFCGGYKALSASG